jgi:hypothetical protein
LPIDRTPLRKKLREAADLFLEREGRPPTAKELSAQARVGSLPTAVLFLRTWRDELGLVRRKREGGVDSGNRAAGGPGLSPVDRTPLRKKFREAADRFLEREGRPPMAKELPVLAGVGSFSSASMFLTAWRWERGISLRVQGTTERTRASVWAAADRFMERMGRSPSARELAGEEIGYCEGTISHHLAAWRKERNVPVMPPAGRIRHDLERAAERLLASQGRTPTARELQDATGQGHRLGIERFLKAWCNDRGLARPETTPLRHVPVHGAVRGRWEAFRETAERFLAHTGRAPTAPELQAEARIGSRFQAEDFLKDWRIGRGVANVPPLRQKMERAAEEFLAAHGRAPMARELVEALGRGCIGRARDFLRAWRETKGLPRPKVPRPASPVREDVRAVIDALAKELGRDPTGREIGNAHGGICYGTALYQRRKWLEMRGLDAPESGGPRGTEKTGHETPERERRP